MSSTNATVHVDVTRLARNLACHETRWGFRPEISREDGAVRVESTTFGFPRVSVATTDGRWLRLHSERAPIDETTRWLAQQSPDLLAASVIWVVGAGYGYILDELATRARADAKFVLLEPESGCLRHSLARRDWTPLIESGRLMLLAGPHYEGWTDAWRMVDLNSAGPTVLCHPVLAQARPDASRHALQLVQQAVSGAQANQEARRRFGGRYLLNTLENVRLLTAAEDAGALAGSATGRPAIVAAAGPSLNRNLAELAATPDWRDRAVLIAVDTALKPCLAAGLAPHYVVAVDPGEANARKLTDLPLASDTALVAEPSIAPRSFDAFHGRTFLFKVSDTHAPWPWLNTQGIDVRRLRAWGSVLTTSFDFALTLGCDPIVFIGADLAYTNGQPHCRNTMYETDWNALVRGNATIEVIWKGSIPNTIAATDLDGHEARTSESLIAFRDWIVAQTTVARSTQFINATGAGILHGPRITPAHLAEIVSQMPARGAERQAPRVHATPTASHAASLAKALTTLVDTPDTSAPFMEWQAFTGGQVQVDDLRAALNRAG